MYKQTGSESVFFELKPNLTDQQSLLLSAFYKLSQERATNNNAPLPIKECDIRYYQQFNGSCGYADDLFAIAINSIDNEHIKQQCEELRRKADKGK